MRTLIVDAVVALAVVVAASAVGIAFNLASDRGLDPFAGYTGYGEPPLPSAEEPHPLPPVGIIRPIPLAEARASGGALFVDVRSAEEFAAEHVRGAVSLPYSILRMMPADQGGGYTDEELAPLKDACTVLIYDAGDGSAETTHAQLRDRFPVLRVVEGGITAWKAAGGAVESGGGS